MWPRPRRIRRVWPVLLLATLAAGTIAFYRKSASAEIGRFDISRDFVHLQLSKGQREYVDKRGVHVVVGHYVGNSMDSLQIPNITKDIINKNMFDPRPYEGDNGEPVQIPAKDFQLMHRLFQINRYNLLASDRIPLNRTLPDVRKKKCRRRYTDLPGLPTTSVIIVFHNEAWSTLMRTVHSVINRSPKNLLREILLVDDSSDREFLRKPLEENVARLSIPTLILRTKKRVGLVNARLMGASEAKGEVLTFLDAHCECTVGRLVRTSFGSYFSK